MRNKLMNADQAAGLIRDGATVATGGFVGIGFAENIAVALAERYARTSAPRDLTLVYAAGQGDGARRGLNHLALPGLVRRVIGGHWGLVPALQKLALANEIEAYNLPQGVISHLFRETAAGKPGLLSHVGLDTFVDPRHGGGKVNARTVDDIVELVHLGGRELLFYHGRPIDIAILRGTSADPLGNITMEREALTLESLAIAMAAHNSGGKVIVQVERLAEHGQLNARQVKIPGILVDAIVLAERPEYHMQTFGQAYSAAYACEERVALDHLAPRALDARKIIARRALMELGHGDVINLGIGMPEGVAEVAAEEHLLDAFTLTAEAGVIGGMPAGGLNFGAASNADAVIDQPCQFDFYDGGGLDCAVLGMAEADCHGNVNVSKFGSHLAGAGGFINISQNAKKVVFVGTFCTGGLALACEGGALRIVSEGRVRKFVKAVEQRSYSGPYANARAQSALYVTERCVFKLVAGGLELIEIAPGIDLERDILAQMDFVPLMSGAPKKMDARLFSEASMGMAND